VVIHRGESYAHPTDSPNANPVPIKKQSRSSAMFFEKEMSEIRWVFLKFLYVSQRSLQVIGQILDAEH